MGTGGFLSQLGFTIGVLAAVLVAALALRAIWSEIGPMFTLLFRRALQPALNEDEERR